MQISENLKQHLSKEAVEEVEEGTGMVHFSKELDALATENWDQFKELSKEELREIIRVLTMESGCVDFELDSNIETLRRIAWTMVSDRRCFHEPDVNLSKHQKDHLNEKNWYQLTDLRGNEKALFRTTQREIQGIVFEDL